MSEESVGRFQEVVSCSLFHEYVQAHESLDDASASPSVVADAVTISAQALCDRYRRYLRRRRLATALLPISAKVIDKVLGDLPGDVADHATAAAEGWLTSHRRLVIYQLDETVAAIIGSRMEAFRRASSENSS